MLMLLIAQCIKMSTSGYISLVSLIGLPVQVRFINASHCEKLYHLRSMTFTSYWKLTSCTTHTVNINGHSIFCSNGLWYVMYLIPWFIVSRVVSGQEHRLQFLCFCLFCSVRWGKGNKYLRSTKLQSLQLISYS